MTLWAVLLLHSCTCTVTHLHSYTLAHIMSNRPYYFMQASTLKLNGYKTASKEVIEAISVQIVSILQDIYRKLNGIVRDDELDYIIFQIERIKNNSFSMYRRPWRLSVKNV